jgi:tRNA pseudouridine13 synthase
MVLKPPPLDKSIGMTVYATPYEGIGGRLRAVLEDFLVEEVLDDIIFKHISEQPKKQGSYVLYSLTKRGLDTLHAVRIVEKSFGARVNYLGIKDANAITTQYITIAAEAERDRIRLPDRLTLKKLGYLPYPLSRRHLVGNRFHIRIRDVEKEEKLPHIIDTVVDKGVPNYFGYQRFGSRRPVTHLIGRALVKRRFDEAVNILLTYTTNEEKDDIQQARRILSEDHLKADLEDLPLTLDLERQVLRSLKAKPNDYINAIRSIPLRVRRLFVNAYQSYMFNRTLSAAIEDDADLSSIYRSDLYAEVRGVRMLGVKRAEEKMIKSKEVVLLCPLVGYNFKKEDFGRLGLYASKVLLEEEVSPRSFYIDEMPELSVGGDIRAATILLTELHIEVSEEVLLLKTILGKGCYITSLLREVMKPQDPLRAGF